MQSMKFTPLILFVALLAGCGGSEVDTPPTPLATLVKQSAEGAGIAAYITSENLTGLVYNPHSIQNEINDFNADGQSSSTVGIDLSQSSNNGPEIANLTYAYGPMLIEDSIPMDKSEEAGDDAHTRTIAQQEIANALQMDSGENVKTVISEINERTARMETALEILTER